MSKTTLDNMLKLVAGLDVVCCITYADEDEAAALADDFSEMDAEMLATPSLRAICRIADLPAVITRVRGEIEAEVMEFYQLHQDDEDEHYQPIWYDAEWDVNDKVTDKLATRKIGFGVLGDNPNAGVMLITLQSLSTK